MQAASYDALDDALERLSGSAIDLANGNFNHAPMVAEALCALDRPAAVMPWIERYSDRLVPREDGGEPVSPDDWRGALGRRDRFAAWSALFAEELRDAPWPAVLDRWAGRLAPGVSAAATHGAIRVGHSVRALAAGETPARRREFADALASWAASYSELPAPERFAAGDDNGALAPGEAIARIAIVPPAQRRPGNITAALARLSAFPEFAPAIGLADLGGERDTMLAALTELFARIYLANAVSPLTAIVFIHGVTSLTALGHIAPYVGDDTARRLLRYGWQVGCGLYACFGSAAAAGDIAPSDETPPSLIDRALAHGDEHVVKFTEACLCRDAVAPSPAYKAAVASALLLIGRR